MNGEQSLILPNKREALLMRLNEFKTNNLSARELKDFKNLTDKSTAIFIKLCWSKLGVSLEQLKKLGQQDINELAGIICEQSRVTALVHTGLLTCIPLLGWLILGMALQVECSENICWKNMRYYWWYRRMKNKYSQDFKPTFSDKEKE